MKGMKRQDRQDYIPENHRDFDIGLTRGWEILNLMIECQIPREKMLDVYDTFMLEHLARVPRWAEEHSGG